MNYLIKNMGCKDCKTSVIHELENLNISFSFIEPGEVYIAEKIPAHIILLLKNAFQKRGLEFIDDKSIILTEKIKSIIIQLVHHSDEWPKTNFSVFLTSKVGYHYTYLANLFSALQGTTIARYIINQKIEKVKQMIISRHFNLKQIASLMQYSSVAHLSAQFKKVTSYSPSHYKNFKCNAKTTRKAA